MQQTSSRAASRAACVPPGDGRRPASLRRRHRIVCLLLAAHLAVLLAAALVHRGALADLPGGVGPGPSGWGWVSLYGIALVDTAVLVLCWRTGELGRTDEERLRSELSAARGTVQAQPSEADRMRADLIAIVSHEFRTPLTGIRGAALTLLKRGDRLDKAGRDRMLHAVLDQQERLSRLLENMLVAARATDVDPSASAEVDAVAAEVVMLATAGRPGTQGVSVVVEADTTARIDRHALHQVLANLIDNALTHGAPGAVPLVTGGADEQGVWVNVSNEGRVIDLTSAGRLFEPFTQVDSGATRDREGIGVGLYVVRRLVEVHGGSVEVHSDSGWVTVTVRLQAGVGPRRPLRSSRTGQTLVPTRLPTP